MRLQQRTAGGRWREVMTFSVEHLEHVQAGGQLLASVAAAAESPIELRIVDSMDVAVLVTIGLGWRVPASAEDYTWVP